MDHEVSNTLNDLRLLKEIHNDGCDSDERESEPPLFPDLTNGFHFGFSQPNLELGSSVSGGFHLGSSLMAHASVNDDSDFIKWFGVNVECSCCPQKSDITYLPLPSDRNGCGSSSVLNDIELLPFQPVFPTSYGFEPALKGFLGDLNVSLSAPNNSELLALLPAPNMDHEVSNTINDLRLLKGIHNDECDSDERQSEPPLFPVLTNGFDFGFAQPNLELGSGVSSGFHLGSSSMAHTSVNDDSDFYMGSSSMAHDCLNDDSNFNMGPPPKKARTS